MNFESAIEQCSLPIIGHETGQFQCYPNYEEIKKYTGALKPWNLEIFRKRLGESGMAGQADDFFKASGKWMAQLYRAEMEMAFRTPGMAGFQLLDLQDYPGQGTALVGILDALWIIRLENRRGMGKNLAMMSYYWLSCLNSVTPGMRRSKAPSR